VAAGVVGVAVAVAVGVVRLRSSPARAR
jgi:hypothetical protein